MEDHDCEMVSVCCGAYPHFELDAYFTGVCGRCHDGTGFECGVDENCTNNTNAVEEQAYNKRHNEP